MNIFSRIRIPKLGKNNFDLSFENKLTCQMGQLIPIVCQEVIPGDEFKMASNILVRFNPLLAPMMHRVDVYTHFFFVPNRLVWDEWEDFITGGVDGLAMPDKPFTTYGELIKHQRNNSTPIIGPNSLSDYLGVNSNFTKKSFSDWYKLKGYSDKEFDNLTDEEIDNILSYLPWADVKIDTLPFRMYQLIFNEYYRNQNTQTEIPIYLGSGEQPFNDDNYPDTNIMFDIRNRNWSLDYFTSALPFSQRGPEQLVPVTGTTPVTFNLNSPDRVLTRNGSGNIVQVNPDTMLGVQYGSPENHLQAGFAKYSQIENDNSVSIPSGSPASIDNSANLSVDYADASISIRDLRRAERIQEWLETAARAGSRYIEQIKGHFGIFSSDTRLQRPEYLGGGKQAVQISAVDQTSATDLDAGTTPLGSMAGKAISGGTTNGFKTKVMEEHGFIIGIMSVLPKGGYHQGLNRKFSRFDKLDYFWPEFQNIGDQEIKNKELFVAQIPSNNDTSTPEGGFGYTPRYSEYKCNHDEVHGDFKTTLSFWHLNREFANQPRISNQFTTTKGNIRQDIFAVETDVEGNPVPNMMIDIFNNIKARRPMYYYEDPQL